MQTELMFSPEDSLVNHIAQPENEKGRMMTATCGPKCLEQFEKFNRPGLWAKTFAGLLIGIEGWYSTRCKLTWKLRATKSHRFYFLLQVSTLRMSGTEYGLLPTPRYNENDQGPRNIEKMKAAGSSWKVQNRGATVTTMAKAGMLPTPRANDAQKGRQRSADPRNGIPGLAMNGLIPTVTTSLGGGAGRQDGTEVNNGGIWNVTDTDSQQRPQRRLYEDEPEETERYASTLNAFSDGPPNWDNFPTVSPLCNGNDGISGKLDRASVFSGVKENKRKKTKKRWVEESLKGGGNAIVPQLAFQIFKSIQQYENSKP